MCLPRGFTTAFRHKSSSLIITRRAESVSSQSSGSKRRQSGAQVRVCAVKRWHSAISGILQGNTWRCYYSTIRRAHYSDDTSKGCYFNGTIAKEYRMFFVLIVFCPAVLLQLSSVLLLLFFGSLVESFRQTTLYIYWDFFFFIVAPCVILL